ncbi:hypothetical protein DYD21_07475 [Rhodohalobacter sp. SW132]|uniref:hypothetical protein n=1 Tax=Rhodohalobacter sp. SW132 TaxID=2293433 RepID=UPI000E275056|nr:hypothetical protein [Rhodohalobacter sp. SW132]REL37618.1 hypothetical protein DYD21_07475 [Rhodohalobacter sp. SW132]
MPDIQSIYPKAENGNKYTQIRIETLQQDHGFDLKKTILATSVCSDEIIQSATNFRDHVALDNPFQIGGLAGFPFAGLTGFHAFAGHIPDDGGAIIIYGPHIGVSESNHTGKVIRTGQRIETSCCGALVGAVGALKNAESPKPDKELDYQQWLLTDQLSRHTDEITESDDPLIAATDRMFEKIDGRIKKLLEKSRDHFKGVRVALLGGIIINTDYGKDDWFDERNFEVHSF